MYKKTLMSLAVASAFAIGPVTASADTISQLLFPGELNQFSDNSGENQGVDDNGNGFLDVGDTLRGTLDFGTLEDLTGSGGTVPLGSGGNSELAGLFEIQVKSKTLVYNGLDGIGGTADDVYDFVFGVYTPFAAEAGGYAGAMVAFWEDTTPDYDRTGTVAQAEATAIDGVLSWVIGFGKDPTVDPACVASGSGCGDELWTARAPQDPSLAALVPVGSSFGVFNFQISTLFWGFTPQYGQVAAFTPTGRAGANGLIDVNASGNILGTLGATSEYEVFNNVDLVVNIVPEPTMLTLFGAGLLGLGAMRRRSKAA
jgi:hypothetical protein